MAVDAGVAEHDLEQEDPGCHAGVHTLGKDHRQRVGLVRRLKQLLARRRLIVGLSDKSKAPGQLGHDWVREAPAHVDGCHGLRMWIVLYHLKQARSRWLVSMEWQLAIHVAFYCLGNMIKEFATCYGRLHTGFYSGACSF